MSSPRPSLELVSHTPASPAPLTIPLPGKTATFAIAILEKIDTGLRECQALILAPTRELAQQIQKVLNTNAAAHTASTTPAPPAPS